jgi:hypothetical protein
LVNHNEKTQFLPEFLSEPIYQSQVKHTKRGKPYRFSGEVDILSRPNAREAESLRGYGKQEKANAYA